MDCKQFGNIQGRNTIDTVWDHTTDTVGEMSATIDTYLADISLSVENLFSLKKYFL